MPLTCNAIGAVYPPRDIDVTARDLLSFAAGLRATRPQLLDDADPGGLVGFPTFCASLEFNSFADASAKGLNPVGYTAQEGRRGVHVGQDSVFHRPIRPRDKLRTVGQIVGARSSRAGAVFTLKVQTVSRDDGEPVVTSWVTQLYRDVPLDGEPQQLEDPPPAPGAAEPGRVRHATDIEIDAAWPHVYAECANIWNPIHSERSVALAAGLPDIIFQGTAVWGLAAREVVEAACAGDATRLLRFSARFSAMVCPNDLLRIEVFEGVDGVIPYSVRNQRGESVLRDGVAVVSRP